MLEADRSNSSMVLMTGNAAALSRARVLEASREAISASIKVRSISSGAQRWVLAVSSSSGASSRIAASLSRRNPAVRSAGRPGAGALMRTPPPRLLLGRIRLGSVPPLWGAGSCGQDRADVGAAPTPERGGPLQRGQEHGVAVRGG